MAEFVEQKIQEMVPEIEELERLGILEASEIRKLIQKRRDFEYQISRPKKDKENFVSYVLFDIKLLDLILLRREKMSMFKQLQHVDYAIISRVKKRLWFMTKLWKGDIDIWKLRITFLKSRKAYNEVSVTFMEMIQIHGNDINVWILWAQWEMEGRKNFQQARSILLSKAPAYHPNSPTLIKEHFRLELLYIEFLKKKSSKTNIEGLEEVIAENREKVLDCGVPEAIYNNALKTFTSPGLFIDFYFVVSQFPFAHRLRDEIYNYLTSHFPNDKDVWRMKGKTLLQDACSVHLSNEAKCGSAEASNALQQSKNDENTNNKDVKTPLTPNGKLHKLFALYDEALEAVGPPFLEGFFQDVFRLLQEVWGVEEFVEMVTQKAFSVFKNMAEHLSVLQFLLWFQLATYCKLSHKKLKKILDLGNKLHPRCPHLQLRSLSFYKSTAKENKVIVRNQHGKFGAMICVELIKNCKKILQKKELYEICCNHHDPTIAKEVRMYRLEKFMGKQGLKNCHNFYKKYRIVPPFCLAFHLAMIERELMADEPSTKLLRLVFDTAIEQFGDKEPNLWICYIEMERKLGSKKNASFIREKVDSKLDLALMQHFVDGKFALESSLMKKNTESNSTMLVDYTEDVKDVSKYKFWSSSSLPPLFEEEVPLMYSAEEDKKVFFSSLVQTWKEVIAEEADLRSAKVSRSLWEDILHLIHGEKVSLQVKKVSLDSLGVNHEAQNFVLTAERKFKDTLVRRGNDKLSDELQAQLISKGKSAISDETKKILEASETLKPDFLQRKQIIPYYISKKRAKKFNKVERLKTVGQAWFNMKAPEITPEVKRDLEVLKMRSILNPKRHYKRNDMKETPKFFQMGTIVDSPIDFYSSRIPVKQRKPTLAEEIIHDQNILRYQKRKYKEIVMEKERVSKKRKMITVIGKSARKGQTKGKGHKVNKNKS